MTEKRDNTTLAEKVRLRRQGLRGMPAPPVVVETHGGHGEVWRRCYQGAPTGACFEEDPGKAVALAAQRPAWAVYEGDCVAALQAGAGAHLRATVLDVDPYGDPWPAIAAFFSSDRPRAPELRAFVNDGLRQKVRLGGAWQVGTLEGVVRRHGNHLYPRYLDVCRELMAEAARPAGYRLVAWAGYYCGALKNMTHYAATLRQEA